MKEDFLSTIKSKEFWIDLLVMDLFACLVLLLHIKWHTMVFCSLIAAVGLYRIRSMDDKRERDICNRVIRHVTKAGRQSKQKGDPYILYKAIDECLPEMRKLLPNKLYKYFPLTDEKTDEMRLSSIKDDVIWGSIPSQFNDPFEAKSMYLTPEDVKEIGLPDVAYEVWESISSELRDRIVTICFTQNPNNMPMWAHYSNNHQGFCVEYAVEERNNLFPVFYTEKRMKAQALLVNLIYELLSKDSSIEGKYLILQHYLLLSAFKDKSWEAEKEVRAIIYNSTSLCAEKGKLISYNDIGVKATKVFIGVSCSEENEKRIIALCNQKNLSYEKCNIVDGEGFSVLEKDMYA